VLAGWAAGGLPHMHPDATGPGTFAHSLDAVHALLGVNSRQSHRQVPHFALLHCRALLRTACDSLL
jgi:hypothetical protein